MPLSLEDTLLNVYHQSLVENRKTVTLEDQSFAVRSTAKRKLKQIDFRFEGRDLRGLEQNPDTKSRWAKIARDGKDWAEFLRSLVLDKRLRRFSRSQTIITPGMGLPLSSCFGICTRSDDYSSFL